MAFILAKKLNMTQVWSEDGKVIPVTVLEALPNKVSLLRTEEKDGYKAVQVALGRKKAEFPLEEGLEPGKEITVAVFNPGDVINISGLSKGRGFAGAVKRHGFHGAPASHGHDHPRAVGSIGQMFPQHVRPGLRMAGHMGHAAATVKNSMVVAVDQEKNLLFVKGGVPGHRGTLLKVITTGTKKDTPKIKEFKHESAGV